MRRLFVKVSLQTCGSITNTNGLMSFPRAALQQDVENEACLLYKMRSLHAGFEERGRLATNTALEIPDPLPSS